MFFSIFDERMNKLCRINEYCLYINNDKFMISRTELKTQQLLNVCCKILDTNTLFLLFLDKQFIHHRYIKFNKSDCKDIYNFK